MKLLILGTILISSFNVLAAAPKCTQEAQNEIDSILNQMEQSESSIQRIDLEFKIRQITFNFGDCRKNPIQREIASIEVEDIQIQQ